MFNKYDVIVVGGGHAGIECSSSSANLGLKVLLITMNLQNIGQMSCNPAMGGIAKGQIIREIDALGGFSGIVTDESTIQFRMLNKSKGPAMWSPRAQCDRKIFSNKWRKILESINNLSLYQDTVKSLIIKKNKVIGVKTFLGITIYSNIVVLTTGTFLNGIIHIGKKKIFGGRISENNSTGITEQLNSLGFVSGRMKTGTSPRVDKRSLDFSKMVKQIGDKNPKKFSFSKTKILNNDKPCYITYTNKKVNNLINKNLDKSPLFIGDITNNGPKYCPSIEEKILRFYDKEKHQIFVEPEGIDTIETYINGFSTSLPENIQYKALKLINGFEKVKIMRFGYAIEYDYFPTYQLNHNLESKNIKNLFFSGQINGTTGYEEAAAQGLIAGINCYLKIKNLPPLILKRNEAYIGVLINDLITKSPEEPYRMFTSRAEYRLILRQDNADIRLTPIAYKIGLVSYKRMKKVENKILNIKKYISILEDEKINYDDIKSLIKNKFNKKLKNKKIKISYLISNNFFIKDIIKIIYDKKIIKEKLSKEVLEQIEIYFKYKYYIKKEKYNIKKYHNLDKMIIPNFIDYKKINSISNEAKEKLSIKKPKTIYQASNISGISPSDINILIIYIRKFFKKN
ncbi:tRNA uridine-5-carboxymethylaminomethyl(34) synthesis enzyme MnmG [Candidatus Shikimatogenerans silvanidophilus]|uniref:tRNA uridine-5-carboxymethylaminomethyl(34) synthesis enzyme MnmG n=1 Tax=Candidatus Shikimatogenerans silvanidophilus TaxID=2782547 RepID=UPI001BADE24C|nr:tRNA uridine-5-carboxymethylaminomethyl(34) synthesis enzyme MnmG [Candidatus Shikimatogenerans silvanidophilus]